MADLIKKAVASPLGDDPLTYVMSDESVDRMGDVIEAKGWRLGNFQKNPVALFAHDHSFIIGHWTDVRVAGGKLVGKLNLLPAGISDRIDEIRAAVEAGVLRAVSVGFSPDPEHMEPNKSGGWLFKAVELLECSLVAVPANANAMQMAKSLNISDDTQSLIFQHDVVESIQPIGKRAASGKSLPVVKLGGLARVMAKPFVIKKINI